MLWFTGAIPLGAASLVPLIAFPLCGVLGVGETSGAYINKLVFLYLGGFLLALGLERWNVHERLALHTLRFTGTSPRRVVAGFMIAAAGLSMWISNTAATIMLLPVAVAMLDALGKSNPGPGVSEGADDRDPSSSPPPSAPLPPHQQKLSPHQQKLTIALLLGLAWAASVGGIATPIGTPTNLAFRGLGRLVRGGGRGSI